MSLHPIIQEFVNTNDPLSLILEKLADKNQFLEMVFLDLIKYLNNKEINQKLLFDIDQTVIKGHADANLYLLFISNSIFYTVSLRQHEKSRSLYAIATTSINKKIHPSVQAEWMIAGSLIKYFEGKLAEAKQLRADSLLLIDKKSPHYFTMLINFARGLALEGTLKELSPENFKILNFPLKGSREPLIAEMNLVNALMIADCKMGFELIEKHQKNFPGRRTEDIRRAYDEFKILAGDLNEINYQEEGYKVLVRAYNSLISSKFDSAGTAYKWLVENKWESYKAWKLIDYIDLHIELCLGNKGKVRLLLKEKEEIGDVNYIDDLFYGRLYLLEKNEEKANEVFCRLMENINRYGAMNRLVFELQFAKEMKLADVLLLTQGWKKNKAGISSQKSKDANIDSIMIVKGVNLLVGNGPAISQVKELVKKYAPLKAPVLVIGETGTGKELVSRAIHDEGVYPEEPFLAINCGALTDTLLQSELFGYVAGAFTGAQKDRKGIFEAAGKGTVFLDEFGDISPLLQVSLLRVLESNEIRMIGATETRKIECRIVIATNIDLQKAVSEKKFREDLYYRLTRFEIKIPALRDRVEDIPLIIDYFLNDDLGKAKKISMELLNALTTYQWPGNIRELKNEIERLKILNFEKEMLSLEDFDFQRLQGFSPKITDAIKNTLAANEKSKSPFSQKNSEDKSVTSERITNIIQRGSKADRRISFIKELFLQYKRLKRNQIVEITNVNPTTATNDLQKLCEEGFIMRHTPTSSPSSFYFEIVDNKIF